MKKRITSLICALLMLVSVPGLASASAPRASDYFSCTDVRAYAESGGKILIEFDINATHTMLEVGAKRVYIYEQQSDGSYVNVYTFNSESAYFYSAMIDTNSAFGEGDLTYQGTAGKNYYATCALYARDSTGSQTLYQNTNVVTAVSP